MKEVSSRWRWKLYSCPSDRKTGVEQSVFNTGKRTAFMKQAGRSRRELVGYIAVCNDETQ